MARKKIIIDPYPDTERWFVTFNDLMTLLLTFFVLLLSMCALDAKSFQGVQQDILNNLAVIKPGDRQEKGAKDKIFTLEETGKKIRLYKNSLFSSGSKKASKEETSSLTELLKEAFKVPVEEENGDSFIDSKGKKSSSPGKSIIDDAYFEPGISIIKQKRGITLRLPSGILFDRGDAQLKETSYPVLEKLASVLKKTKSLIYIEGHTDSQPITTAQYASNWELSVDRASRVAEFILQHYGAAPEQIGIGGYGDSMPLVPETSDENKAQNRRVEIVFSNSK